MDEGKYQAACFFSVILLHKFCVILFECITLLCIVILRYFNTLFQKELTLKDKDPTFALPVLQYFELYSFV